MKNKKGFSLVVLVITIIITIIISGTVIISTINSNIINRAKETTFKANTTKYIEELDTYHALQKIANRNYQRNTLNESEDLATYIPSMKEDDVTEFNITNGELRYIGRDEIKRQWAQNLNILVLDIGLASEM